MDKEFTKITFVGDLECFKMQNEAIMKKYGKYDYWESMALVKRLFKGSDYVVGNLETPVADGDPTDAPVRFNTPKSFLEAIKKLGINFLQTCNNHSLDRGEDGADQTINHLEKFGFDHSGTYRTEEESNQIFVKDINGIKFAFVCCTYGTNSKLNGVILPQDRIWKVDLLKKQDKLSRWQWKPEYGPMIVAFEPDSVNKAAITNSANIPYVERIKYKIRKAKELADIVIVLSHVGGQYNPSPGSYTKYTIDWITKEQVDLVVAGHPHVPHRFEMINDVFCAYSLGNFHFSPGHDHYLTNVFSEYGLVLYTFWDNKTKKLAKASFSIVKNVVGDDGISTTFPLLDWYNSRENKVEKESIEIENEAIVNRVLGSAKSVQIQEIYDIFCAKDF